jgi:hypothetical protein
MMLAELLSSAIAIPLIATGIAIVVVAQAAGRRGRPGVR